MRKFNKSNKNTKFNNTNNENRKPYSEYSDEEKEKLISKSLAFYLRHGHTTGLIYYKEGYVDEEQLFNMRTLCRFSKSDIQQILHKSYSETSKAPRFQEMFLHGRVYVKANYGHSKEVLDLCTNTFPLDGETLSAFSSSYNKRINDVHSSASKIQLDERSLLKLCVKVVAKNIKDFESLEGIGDSFALECIIEVLFCLHSKLGKFVSQQFLIFFVSGTEKYQKTK